MPKSLAIVLEMASNLDQYGDLRLRKMDKGTTGTALQKPEPKAKDAVNEARGPETPKPPVATIARIILADPKESHKRDGKFRFKLEVWHYWTTLTVKRYTEDPKWRETMAKSIRKDVRERLENRGHDAELGPTEDIIEYMEWEIARLGPQTLREPEFEQDYLMKHPGILDR